MKFSGGKLLGETHYKYLIRPQSKTPYITFTDGKLINEEKLLRQTVRSYDDIDEIEEVASRFYAGDEAKLVHDILKINIGSYLDTEIAFQQTIDDEEGERNKQDRIDLALLDEDGTIYFCEVKRENDDRLYSREEAKQKVIDQVRGYLEMLNDHEAEITESYSRVCENLASIYEKCQNADKKWLERLSRFSTKGSLRIHEEIILLIVSREKDEDERDEGRRVKPANLKNLGKGKFKDGVIIGPRPVGDFNLKNIKSAL